LDKPFIYVRNKAKEHGRQNLIEGYLRGNEKVLVIEDLISTGGSCLSAVESLRTSGCNVVGVMAIFSYGFESARKAFEEAECTFSTLANYDVLLEEAIKIGYINSEDIATLKKWRQDPQNWLQVQ
jgi:orotate phosphoribosyltransferase